MTEQQAMPRRPFFNPWRIGGWSLVAMLLSLPAILRFPWTASDFIIMGVLLGSVGLGIEFLVARAGNIFVRLGAVVLMLTVFLTIWVNLAVGMIGDGNAYNLLFLIPVAVGISGVTAFKLEPRKSAAIALIAGILQVVIGLGGFGQDPRGALFSATFGLFWLFAAALFRAGANR